MKNSEITLKKLNAAFEEWSGKPKKVIELRRKEKNETVPTKLDLLYFQPDESDGLEGDEFFTSIATAGMSMRVMKGPYENVELLLQVQGTYSDEDLEAVARRLGELAVAPFREDSYFVPDQVVRNFEFPLFEKMDCVLITNVGVNVETWLPGIEPPVLLLWVKPLFESEAKIAEKIGDVKTAQQFYKKGVNWDDPERDPLKLTTPKVTKKKSGTKSSKTKKSAAKSKTSGAKKPDK